MFSSDDILSELGLEAPRIGRGRRPGPPPAYVRDLEDSDLFALGNQDIAKPTLKSLRHSHHQLARLLAEGRSSVECHAITGYTSVRIRQLKDDPTFQELIAHYTRIKDEIYLDVHARLATLGVDTIEELHQRLEEQPHSFKSKELMDLAALVLDRSGHGPKSTQQVNLGVAIFNDESIRRIKDEAEARRAGAVRQIEGFAGPVDSVPLRRAEPVREHPSGEGNQGLGPGLREEVHSLVEEPTS